MKREDVKREDVNRARVRSSRRILVLVTFHVFTFHALVSPALAQPTQEEVFKSIGDSVNQSADSTRAVAVLAGIAGVLVLLVVVGQWRSRERPARGLNHHGRLIKEVLRGLPLKGAELKQIKLLSQSARPGGREERVHSPLTLLLCPSLLAEAAKQSRAKADLPVVASLVKRLLAGR
jgi:hypothetical protein